MATNNKDNKSPIPAAPANLSAAELAIKRTANPTASSTQAAQGSLKGPTEVSRLRPEETKTPVVQSATEQDVAFQRFIQLALIENKEDLNASLPRFDSLFDEPIKIGEQEMKSRDDVARNVDKLSNIADIAQGRARPSHDYNIDFSGFPRQNFSGSWNKISSQPVKVDQNFALNGSFQQAFQVVLASEGGFSNHKSDKGGATIYGIASRSNPREYQMIMDQLGRGDKAGAMQTTMMTYKTKYWDNVKGIENMSPSARLVAFDAAVNHGVGFANKMVAEIGTDADSMLNYRGQKYAAIINNDPSQSVFEKGWGNRLAKLDTLTDVSERNAMKFAAAPTSKANLRDPAPQPS